MIELYLIFFLISAILFAAIVFYSLRKKSKNHKTQRQDYVDPLFAEVANKHKKPHSGDDSQDQQKPNVEKSHDTGSLDDPKSTSSNSQQTPSTHEFEAPKRDENTAAILTDMVAQINISEPLEQQDLLKLFRKYDYKFKRKVRLYGLNQLTELWCDIEYELPATQFVELGIAIQLADRDGAMTKKELHDFQQMALDFSDTYDAPFEFSITNDDALKQAEILDKLGRRYDSMAVLNVVPRNKSGFRVADIESCARDLRLTADKNGLFLKTHGHRQNITVQYRLASTDGEGQFGLQEESMAPVHELVLYMNVPATQDPEAVFEDMATDANSLATWLDGKVVDRNGRTMTPRLYNTLTQQIAEIVNNMQQDGLQAGDEISKKLF